MRTLCLFLAASALGLSSLAAHADTYTYDFTATTAGQHNSQVIDTFEFTLNNLLTIGNTPVTINSSDSTDFSCSINGSSCSSVTININSSYHGQDESSIDLNPSHGPSTDFNSLSASDFNLGTNYDTAGYYPTTYITLSVTDNSNNDCPPTDPSPVPEPSTLAMLGTGLIGAAGAVRRRLSR